MNRARLILTALLSALFGAAVASGIMAWEPWEGNDLPSAADRIALCDEFYHGQQSVLDSCWALATREPRRWECYARFPDSDLALSTCLRERH